MKDREHRWIHAPETGQNAPSAKPARSVAAARDADDVELARAVRDTLNVNTHHAAIERLEELLDVEKDAASRQSVAEAWKALAFATRRTSTWDGCQHDAVAAERALATLRARGIDPEASDPTEPAAAAKSACTNPNCESGAVQVDECELCNGPIWQPCPTCKGADPC